MKNQFNWLLFFCVISLKVSFGQIDNPALGARAVAMANASATLKENWALFNNVAGLASLENISVFFAYQNRFGISAFQTFALGVLTPLQLGVAGLQFSRFGDDLYSEQKIALAYSYEIDKVSLGLKVNYIQLQIQDLGSKGTFAFEFGGVAELIPQLFFAAHIYNFNQAKLKSNFEEDKPIPIVMKAGLSYRPIQALLLNVELEKDLDFEAVFKSGLEYRLIKNVFLRTGIQSNPSINYFGFGLNPKKLSFDYALSSESNLGLSHHISMTYRFGEKK